MSVPTVRRPRSLLPAWLCFFLLWSCSAWSGNIGIYSGTFDPLHQSHLSLAIRAVDLLKLDALYLLPNYAPSHKPGASAFGHRYDMVQLAIRRHPALRTLPATSFEQAWKRNSAEVVPLLIREIMTREGPQNTFLQICGTDSFERMMAAGYLPLNQSPLIIAVMARKGYASPRLTRRAEELHRSGRIRFYDPDLPEISSTAIRKALQASEEPEPGQLPEFILRYLQRECLYGAPRPTINVPTGFTSHKQALTPGHGLPFQPEELGKLFSPAVLDAPMTLDLDRYLGTHLPDTLRTLILTRPVRVTILGGFLEDALGWLPSQGFTEVTLFRPDKQDRIQLCYLLAERDHGPHLFVTNLFGRDRLRHITLQYAQLMARNLIPLDRLEVVLRSDFDDLGTRLCRESLAAVEGDDRTVAFLGYRGALNFVLTDLEALRRLRGPAAAAQWSLPDLDEIRAALPPGQALRVPNEGNGCFPYCTYHLSDRAGKPLRIIAFRNLYGDQTGTAIRGLLERGVRTFVLFGNAGGLGEVVPGEVRAPTVFTDGNTVLRLPNVATLDFPSGTSWSVPSILVESRSWLDRARAFSLVDVETFSAAQALQGHPEATVYVGLLVSDLPGRQDITWKDEDTEEFLLAKREFFSRVLRRLMSGRFRSFADTAAAAESTP